MTATAEAYWRWVDENYDRFLRFADRFPAPAGRDPRDIVQDAVVAAVAWWLRAGDCPDEARVRSYVFRIIHNLKADALAADRAHPIVSIDSVQHGMAAQPRSLPCASLAAGLLASDATAPSEASLAGDLLWLQVDLAPRAAQPPDDVATILDGYIPIFEYARERLDPRAIIIIDLHYREREPLSKIARRLGITADHTRQIKLRALRTLRRLLEGSVDASGNGDGPDDDGGGGGGGTRKPACHRCADAGGHAGPRQRRARASARPDVGPRTERRQQPASAPSTAAYGSGLNQDEKLPFEKDPLIALLELYGRHCALHGIRMFTHARIDREKDVSMRSQSIGEPIDIFVDAIGDIDGIEVVGTIDSEQGIDDDDRDDDRDDDIDANEMYDQ